MKDILSLFVDDIEDIKFFDINYFVLSNTDDWFRRSRIIKCIKEDVKMTFPLYGSENKLHDGNHRIRVLKDLGYKKVPVKMKF